MVIAVAIGVSIVGGLMIGIFGIIAVSVRREDRQYSLTRPAGGLAARGVRRLTGVGMRDVTSPALWAQSAERVLR